MTIQNLTTYTEVDPIASLTVTSSRASFIFAGTEQAYVYKDFGVNYFEGDFEVDLTFRYSLGSSMGYTALCLFSNQLGDPNVFTQSLGLIWNAGTVYVADITTGNLDLLDGTINPNTDRYYTIRRVGLTCTVERYASLPRTTPAFTFSFTLNALEAFRYFQVAAEYPGGADPFTGYVEEVDLTVTTAAIEPGVPSIPRSSKFIASKLQSSKFIGSK